MIALNGHLQVTTKKGALLMSDHPIGIIATPAQNLNIIGIKL